MKGEERSGFFSIVTHSILLLVDDPEPASTQGPLIVLSGLKEEEEKKEEEKEMKLGRTCERSWRGVGYDQRLYNLK